MKKSPLIAHLGLLQETVSPNALLRRESEQDYATTLRAALLNILSREGEIALIGQETYPRKQKPHSVLSPLSHGSVLYPDGLFTPLWLDRHLGRIPACMLHFVDPDDPDALGKISQARGNLQQKTRYFLVLLLPRSQSPSTSLLTQ